MVSAFISFTRSLLFEIGAVLLLPLVIGAEGIWLAVVVAECASVTLTAICIVKLGPRYGLRESTGNAGD